MPTRSAITGRFVAAARAFTHPKTTVTESTRHDSRAPLADHFDPTDETRVWVPQGATSFVVDPVKRTVTFEFRDWSSK